MAGRLDDKVAVIIGPRPREQDFELWARKVGWRETAD
jgi:hypothetical protein